MEHLKPWHPITWPCRLDFLAWRETKDSPWIEVLAYNYALGDKTFIERAPSLEAIGGASQPKPAQPECICGYDGRNNERDSNFDCPVHFPKTAQPGTALPVLKTTEDLRRHWFVESSVPGEAYDDLRDDFDTLQAALASCQEERDDLREMYRMVFEQGKELKAHLSATAERTAELERALHRTERIVKQRDEQIRDEELAFSHANEAYGKLESDLTACQEREQRLRDALKAARQNVCAMAALANCWKEDSAEEIGEIKDHTTVIIDAALSPEAQEGR